jgi:hypothetical protein
MRVRVAFIGSEMTSVSPAGFAISVGTITGVTDSDVAVTTITCGSFVVVNLSNIPQESSVRARKEMSRIFFII